MTTLVEKKLNENVVVATVENWMGVELVRFEGEDSSFKAIEWRENEAENYASNDNGRSIDIESDEYEERYNGMSEDLYVIGYDENDNKIGVEFG